MSFLRRSRKRRGGEPPAEEAAAAEDSRREAAAPDGTEGPPGGSAAKSTGEPETDTGEGKRKRWPGFRESLRATRHALAPVGKRRVVAASVGLMGISAGVVLLFSGVSFWWTSQPSFCGRCHVMAPYVEKWKQSPHHDVTCESCHLPPGFFGFLGGKIAGLQVVMNYLRGNYEDWSFNAAVSNASCLRCHEAILGKDLVDPKTEIRVSHLNIVRAGAKCTNCHSTVAHGAAIPPGSETHPTMDTCLKCHNGKIAPLRCSFCHVGREPPSLPPTAPPSISAAGR